MSALFGSWASMQDIQTLDDILDHFAVPERVRRAFELQVGSPGADLRLLAALPKAALITGCVARHRPTRASYHPSRRLRWAWYGGWHVVWW